MEPTFRTVIPVRPLPSRISHQAVTLVVGSCFAEHIGGRLATYRFPSLCNPAGILFNPLSIESALRRVMTKEPFSAADLLFHGGRWHGIEHHGAFSGRDPESTLTAMNEALAYAAEMFARASFLLLTFGTAAVYTHKETGRVVANCHKLPHEAFERCLVPSTDIVARYERCIADLLGARPGLRIVLTVSPVRHLRLDPHENSVSKARLIDACYALESHFECVSYFPAYEIMMDELRDYRFYADDMAHPGEVAVAYIWERFCEACVEERSRVFIREFEPVVRAMAHRPNDRQDPAMPEFAAHNLARLRNLRDAWPGIDLGPAEDHFSALLR